MEAFGQVAWAYRKLNQYDKALSVNEYTMDHYWPGKDRAGYAQQGIVLCQIGLGDLAAADQALDCLIQNFSEDAEATVEDWLKIGVFWALQGLGRGL